MKSNIKLLFENLIWVVILSLTFANDNILFSQQAQIESFLRNTRVTDIKNDGVDIWVATEGNGIFKFDKVTNKWINFSSENKKIKQDFFYCIEVGNRYVWAGSADGLYIYDKKRKRWKKGNSV